MRCSVQAAIRFMESDPEGFENAFTAQVANNQLRDFMAEHPKKKK